MRRISSRTLYAKRGSKFVPVGREDLILPYGVGDYLVRVRNGSRSIRCVKTGIDVDHARLELLMDEAAQALARAITKHSEAEPKVRPWNEKEKKAWAAYKRIAGTESLTLSIKSACEIAQMAVVVLRENLRELDAPRRPEGCADVFAERRLE